MQRIERSIFLLFVVPLLVATPVRADDPALRERIERAIDSAGRFLVSQQAEDGSWRSGVHGSFRDGTGLTPQVLCALSNIESPDESVRESIARGERFVLSMTDANGKLIDPYKQLTFPVYTTAQVVRLLEPGDIRNAWIARLQERQLSAHLGWAPADLPFGGWGYSPAIPHKGDTGLLIDSNISATVFAIEALHLAGIRNDDALIFTDRVQNFPNGDGGVHFSAEDPAMNKAGAAADGTFHSYGSATADGLRVMLLCGRDASHPRVIAARKWLVDRFDATRNAGTFNPDREFLRDSSYFYWCASSAAALAQLEERSIPWKTQLAGALLERQRPDGSWKNDASGVKEDDPLVATSLALIALLTCLD